VNRYERLRLGFMFNGSVLCQQGVNAGMSQQGGSRKCSQGSSRRQQVSRTQVKVRVIGEVAEERVHKFRDQESVVVSE
jgi:hypothetical protein